MGCVGTVTHLSVGTDNTFLTRILRIFNQSKFFFNQEMMEVDKFDQLPPESQTKELFTIIKVRKRFLAPKHFIEVPFRQRTPNIFLLWLRGFKPRVDHIRHFGGNLLTLFCKLHLFRALRHKYYSSKIVQLTKGLVNLLPKSFMSLTPD